MRHLRELFAGPRWAVRTLHEAHQYAAHRHEWPDAWRAGFERGYQAGKDER